MERGFANVEEAAVTIAAYMPDRKKSASGPEGLRRYLRQGDDGRFRWHWDPRFVAGVMQTRAAADSAEMLSDAAANLRLPVHLIRGGSSDMISDDGLLAFKALVPGATYTDIVGAGHMVVGDQNDSFSHAVLEFLTQLAPS